MVDFHDIIQRIGRDISPLLGLGKVADYIPELAGESPERFGMCLVTLDGEAHVMGEADHPFSIQSISKVFTLAMVFSEVGEKLWERVGVEPSGTAFNSLIQLELENGVPRNPFINAGAMVVTDILCDMYKRPEKAILEFINALLPDSAVDYNHRVADSEKQEGFRNAALINFMRHYRNIHNPVEKVLDTYFHQCSVEMSCRQLAQAFLPLANHGVVPGTDRRILTKSQTKRLNALMQTCGFYDEAGEFSFRVGLPGKSGVGGGIVALMPQKFAVAVWSPGLNKKGNSLAGIQALEWLTSYSGISVF